MDLALVSKTSSCPLVVVPSMCESLQGGGSDLLGNYAKKAQSSLDLATAELRSPFIWQAASFGPNISIQDQQVTTGSDTTNA